MTHQPLKVLIVEADGSAAESCREAICRALPAAHVDVSPSDGSAMTRLERMARSGTPQPLYDAVVVNVESATNRPVALLEELAQILPGTPVLAIRTLEPPPAGLDPITAWTAEVVRATPGYPPHLAVILRLHIEQRRLLAEIERQRIELVDQASRDDLTALANRSRFNETVENEIARALRFHRPLTLVSLNIDGMKLINDTHGYSAGDAALLHVANCLRGEVRRFEIAARTGGDTFAVLLVDTNFDGGRQVAELRRRIAEAPIRSVGVVTVSIGVAALPARGILERFDPDCRRSRFRSSVEGTKSSSRQPQPAQRTVRRASANTLQGCRRGHRQPR
ncbi:MAG: diguanylate cyclase [Blastocatellia bacterium]|nr:diguanylate cyclase [Blastocatellia bacterium]